MTRKTTDAQSPAAETPAVPEFELSFEDVDVPIFTRTAVEDNPFLASVKALAEDWDEETGRSRRAKSFVVPNAALPKIARQLAAAGKEIGKSIRQKKEDAGNDRTRLTFLPVNLIVRPPSEASIAKREAKKAEKAAQIAANDAAVNAELDAQTEQHNEEGAA